MSRCVIIGVSVAHVLRAVVGVLRCSGRVRDICVWPIVVGLALEVGGIGYVGMRMHCRLGIGTVARAQSHRDG